MIKHDAVPKYFKHRYLLSDFGWVVMDPLDGRESNIIQDLSHSSSEERVAMPADTVISYWKPEVAVRLVTDFTKYPLDYGTLFQLVPHFTIAVLQFLMQLIRMSSTRS